MKIRFFFFFCITLFVFYSCSKDIELYSGTWRNDLNGTSIEIAFYDEHVVFISDIWNDSAELTDYFNKGSYDINSRRINAVVNGAERFATLLHIDATSMILLVDNGVEYKFYREF